MAWEQRRNGMYFYRKRRSGGRVVSEYVGSGELAEAIAMLDAAFRRGRQAEARQWREECDDILQLDRRIDEVDNAVQALLAGIYLATGHHQSKRVWRRIHG